MGPIKGRILIDYDSIEDLVKKLEKKGRVTERIKTGLEEKDIYSYEQLVDFLGKSKYIRDGIRYPMFAGIGPESLKIIYTHLNSLGVCPFEDGYKENELFSTED